MTSRHPDKLCDQISDALVGVYLRQDLLARIVAESAVSTGIRFVSITSATDVVVDVPCIGRSVSCTRRNPGHRVPARQVQRTDMRCRDQFLRVRSRAKAYD